MPDSPLVIYDGFCNLCDGSVNFILKWESGAVLKFSPSHCEYAQQQLKRFGVGEMSTESIILIDSESVYLKSDAVIGIAKYLRQPWSLLKYARIVPRGLRDWLYGIIARNRYRIFGKRETCTIPRKVDPERFVDT